MKLSIKKLAHKTLSLAVSVCMVCTLTPSVAWASSGGSSVGEEGNFQVDSSGVAMGGATAVTAESYDNTFVFKSITPADVAATSVDDFQTKADANPFVATFDGVPTEQSDVTWSWVECTYDAATGNYTEITVTDESDPNYGKLKNFGNLATDTYNKGAFPSVEGNAQFQYPPTGGSFDVSQLEQNKYYLVTCTLTEKAGNKRTATAKARVSINSHYPSMVVRGVDTTDNNNPVPEYTMVGGFYSDLGSMSSPIFQVTPIENDTDAYKELYGYAMGQTKSEKILDPVSLEVQNLFPPTGEPYYANDTTIYLPLPDEIASMSPVPATVNVYRYYTDAEGNQKVEVIQGTVRDGVADDGTTTDTSYKTVCFANPSNQKELGTYAIGMPIEGEITISTHATEGGSINPVKSAAKYDLDETPQFTASAMSAGYELTNFTISVNSGTPVDAKAADVTANSLTFHPVEYGIANGDTVDITAVFAKSTNTTKYDVSVKLTADNGGKGTVTFMSADGTSAVKTVSVNGTQTMNMQANKGLLLQFNTDEPSNTSVKSVKINGKEVSVNGISLMLGAIPAPETTPFIEVVYQGNTSTSGQTIAKYNAEAKISPSSATRPRAKFYDESGNVVETTKWTQVNSGTVITVRTRPNGNYMLKSVIIKDEVTGASSDVSSSVIQKNIGTEASPLIESTIQVVVVSNMTITCNYVGGSATLSGTVGEGGGIIFIPSSPSARSVTSSTMSLMSADEMETQGTVTADYPIPEGQAVRACIPVEPGYVISEFIFDDNDVTPLLTAYDVGGTLHVEGGTIAYYTITFANKYEHDADDGIWDDVVGEDGRVYAGGTDKVVYVTDPSVPFTLTFEPIVITPDKYYTVFTSVGGVGGGNITPNISVGEGGGADVYFFPNDGYKVQDVKLDGVSVLADVDEDYTHLGIANINEDHRVEVTFTPGSQPQKTRYTITPRYGVGGFVSPESPTEYYEGTDATISFFPSTGYKLDYVTDSNVRDSNNKLVPVTTENNTYTFEVTTDATIEAYFTKVDVRPSPTYSVTVTSNDGGTVTPLGTSTVVAQGDLPITIIPDKGYKVAAVMQVSDTSGGSGLDMAANIEDGVYTVTGVRQNTTVEVMFEADPAAPEPTYTYIPLTTPGNTNLGDGATLSPSMESLTVVEEYGDYADPLTKTGHGNAPLSFTVNILDGYSLNDSDGIVVKDGETTLTKDDGLSVNKTSDGIYSIVVPKDHVTASLLIEVNTHKNDTVKNDVEMVDVTLVKQGSGTIEPNGGEAGVVKVAKGGTQTFNFKPADGWKVENAYLNGSPVTVSNSSYTMYNVQSSYELSVVFSEIKKDPATGQPTEPVPPAVQQNTVNVRWSDPASMGALGTLSPEGNSLVNVGNNFYVSVNANGDGYETHVYLSNVAAPNELALVGGTAEITSAKIAEIVEANKKAGYPDSPVQVIATIKKMQSPDYVKLVVTPMEGGTASPLGVTTYKKTTEAMSQKVAVIPDEGKAVKAVEVSYDNGDTYRAITVHDANLVYDVAVNSDTLVRITFEDEKSTSTKPTGTELREKMRYTVNAVADGGGTVSPSISQVYAGGSQDISVYPAQGFELTALTGASAATVESLKNGGTYTVSNINADKTIVATFTKVETPQAEQFYSIFASVDDASKGVNTGDKGGSISPEGRVTVNAGGSQSFTIMPEPNCKIDLIYIDYLDSNLTDVSIKGSEFNGSSYTLFDVKCNVNFIVKFAPIDKSKGDQPGSAVLTNSIVASSSVGGTISPSGVRKVEKGGAAMFSFLPQAGFKLSYVQIDGHNIPASSIRSNQYTFSDVNEDHTIKAIFMDESENPKMFDTVIATSGPNGTITPNGSVMVEKGTDQTFVVSPYFGYETDVVKIGNTDAKVTSGTDIAEGVEYSFDGNTLRLVDVDLPEGKVLKVSAFFKETSGGASTGVSSSVEYVKVTGKVVTASAEAGGAMSINNGLNNLIYDASNPNYFVTIAPNSKSMIDSVTLKYADGTEDRKTGSDALAIFEAGGITLNLTDVKSAGGVRVTVVFRELTATEQGQIEGTQTPTITPATYYDVVISSTGSGSVTPLGHKQVKSGKPMAVQMIPAKGYTVASLKINDENKDLNTDANFDKSTMTYTIPAVAENYSVDVQFAYVAKDEITFHTITTEVEGEGTITSSMDIQNGGSALIYLIPKEGYKLSSIIVDGGEPQSYSAITYAFRNVTGAHTIKAVFVPREKDSSGNYTDEVPTIKTKTVTSKVGMGKGVVNPGETEVPEGMSQEFTFAPTNSDSEVYVPSTATFNGVTTDLAENATSITVWPTTDGANELVINFVAADTPDNGVVDVEVEVEVTVDTSVSLGTTGEVHGTAWPTEATVPYGGSATVYIFPDEGWYVPDDGVKRDNGWNVEVHPVKNDDITQVINYVNGNQQGNVTIYSANRTSEVQELVSYSVPAAQAQNVQAAYNGSAMNTMAADTGAPSEIASAYYVQVENLTDAVTNLDVTFKKIPSNHTYTMFKTKKAVMNITQTGLGLTSPIGAAPLNAGEIAVGGKQDITLIPQEGYYIDTVTYTEYTGTGSSATVSDSGALTPVRVGGGKSIATYRAGNCDRVDIVVNYKPISEAPSPVNISLASAKMVGSDGKIVKDASGNDLELDVTISLDGRMTDPFSFMNGKRGMLLENEGDTSGYGFPVNALSQLFFSAKSPDDNALVLEQAYFGDTKLNLPSSTSAYVIPAASGSLSLVFRELKPGETVIGDDANGFQVTSQAMGNGKGTVTPKKVTRAANIPVTFEFRPYEAEEDHNMVTKVVVQWLKADGSVDNEQVVDSSEYGKEGRYTLKGINQDVNVQVWFQPCYIMDVSWDSNQGFIFPNNKPGEFLKLDKEKYETINFIVAPYEGYEVQNFSFNGDENAYASLIQSRSAADCLLANFEGLEVGKMSDGMGVGQDGEAAEAEAQQLNAMAYEDLVPSELAELSAPPVSGANKLARVYKYTTRVTNNNNKLAATFYDTSAVRTFNITTNAATVENGSITPGYSPVIVPEGTAQSFTFKPIEGYQVATLKIDGESVEATETYTFSAVDSDHTLEVTFGPTQSSVTGVDRLVRTLSGLAKTGDLTGPIIGVLLLIAALGLGVTAFSFIRRGKRRKAQAQRR